MQPCIFCGKEDTPGHDCVAGAEPEAFEGLSDEVVEAISAKVTPEQVLALRQALTDQPQHVAAVLRVLHQEPWWPKLATADTQRRRLRTIRDAANAAGYPVCSTNAGYWLGTAADVDASARRARRFADGANLRAAVLEGLAQSMREPL
jgi:hypothetical protein